MSSQTIDKYLQHLRASGKSESTQTAYLKDVEQYLNFLNNRNFRDSSREDIKVFVSALKSKKIKIKTICRKLNSIRSFFRFLVDQGEISVDPTETVVYPKAPIRKQRILTDLEYQNLLNSSKSNLRLYTMVMLLLQTGIRISELSDLKINNLYMEFSEPYLQTHTKARQIPLNDKVYFVLKDYLSKHSKSDKKDFPLFYTNREKNIAVRNIRSSIDRAFRNAGIKDATVNDLRNTFIVKQLIAGNSIEFVAEIVGHKTTVTTERYLRLIGKKYNPSKEKLVEL